MGANPSVSSQKNGAVERLAQSLMNVIRKTLNFGKIDGAILNETICAVKFLTIWALKHDHTLSKPWNFCYDNRKNYWLQNNCKPAWSSKEKKDKTLQNYINKYVIKGKKLYITYLKIVDGVLVYKDRKTKLDACWCPGYKIIERINKGAIMMTNDITSFNWTNNLLNQTYLLDAGCCRINKWS